MLHIKNWEIISDTIKLIALRVKSKNEIIMEMDKIYSENN